MEDGRQHPLEHGAQMLDIGTQTPPGVLPPELIVHNIDRTRSLPTELLSHIFGLYTSSCMPIIDANLEEHLRRGASNYSWLYVLEVCRRWYAIAIHSAILWTTIHFPLNPAFVEFCLRRSQSLSLTVSYNEHRRWGNEKTLHSVLTHIHRIRHLQLIVHSKTWHHVRELVERTPKDKFQSFSFSIYRLKQNYQTRSLSLMNAHSLQDLHLKGPLRFDGLAMLPGLKKLRITYVSLNPHPFPVSSLLRALDNMPALTVLRLLGVELALADVEPPRTVRATHLTELCVTQIGSSISSTAKLLDHLITPGTTHLRLSYKRSGVDTAADLMFTSLQRRLAGVRCIDTPPPILSLRIWFLPSCTVLTGLRTFGDAAGILSCSSSCLLDHVFDIEFPAPVEVCNLVERLAGGVFQGVRCLVLTGTALIGSQIPSLSSSMPNVETLFCHLSWGSGAEDLLVPSGSVLEHRSFQAPLPWPKATRLVLSHVAFSECDYQQLPHSGCAQALRDVLLYRRMHGCALLDTLVIEIPSRLDRLHILEVFSGCAEVVDVVLLEEPVHS